MGGKQCIQNKEERAKISVNNGQLHLRKQIAWTKFTSGDIEDIQTASFHPVHVFDKLNNFNPSALIPFCAFGGDMTVLGRMDANFSLPVCSVFQPRVLHGQLCYAVDVNKVPGVDTFKQGPNNGLTLFIDYNDERMIDIDDGFRKKRIPFETNIHEQHQNKKVKIYINTLEPFNGH